MATIQISLSEYLKAAAESRATAAGYGSVDEYIVSLIEADEVAPISDETEAELLRGLSSGPAVAITPEFISELRDRAKRRA